MQFSIDYETLTPERFQPTHQKLLVSVTDPNGPTVRNWMDPLVHKRIRLEKGYLRLIKLGVTPKDIWKNYVGLNPRVEICTPVLCKKQTPSQWKLHYRIPKCPEGHNIIFQLMDKEDDGNTPLPTFQIIVRKGILNLRYAEITSEGKRGLLVYKPLMSMDHLWDKWFTITVEGVLDYHKGYFSVIVEHCSNVGITDVHYKSPVMATASRSPKPVKMAYGVYGYPGPDFSLHVKKLSYKFL